MSTTTLDRTTTEHETTYAPYHVYHAEAHVLSGKLDRPIQQNIERQIPVHLEDRRGGHLTRITEDFSLEGFISFQRGETRVSGSAGVKKPGWVTLSTSILEGLNVFDVITADRVVSQVSTRHAQVNGHVPDVTFLGTQFKNLALNGLTITPKFDLGVCGARPSGDEPDLPYVTSEPLLTAAKKQVERVLRCKTLPDNVREEYDRRLVTLQILSSKGRVGKSCHEATHITCSLIQDIEIEGLEHTKIPGVEILGNVIVIQDFGAVALAEVEVGLEFSKEHHRPANGSIAAKPRLSNYFQTTMLQMHLGCIGHGTVSAGTTKSNGNTAP